MLTLGVMKLVDMMDTLIRIAFNYSALGVWCPITWGHLECIYVACMMTLEEIGDSFTPCTLCSWDKFRGFMQNAPTIGDLFADAVGVEWHVEAHLD
jgi:hypothetical protein